MPRSTESPTRWRRALSVLMATMIVTAFTPFQVIGAFGIVPTPDTFYVDATNGDDANPGTMAEPFETIAYATSMVGDGDTVLVQPGSYDSTPTVLSGVSDVRVASVSGAAVTALVGASGAPVFVVGGCSNVEIEGFTITGGAYEYGGGILIDESSGSIDDCVIIENLAAAGAGIALVDSEFAIEGCEVTDNGALLAAGGLGIWNSWAEVTDCEISWNGSLEMAELGAVPADLPPATAVGGGVGIAGSWAIFTGTTIADNMAGGGAGVAGAESLVGFDQCVITSNETEEGFGGDRLTVSQSESIFDANPAVDAVAAIDSVDIDALLSRLIGNGGGVATVDCLTVGMDSEFSENYAINGGGGVFSAYGYGPVPDAAAAASVLGLQVPMMGMTGFMGCNFEDNAAEAGGALFVDSGDVFSTAASKTETDLRADRATDARPAIAEPVAADVLLQNTTFTGNSAFAGIVEIYSSGRMDVGNCLLANNYAELEGILTHFGDSMVEAAIDDVEEEPDVTVTNTTIADNEVGMGISLYGPGFWDVRNTIIWGNTPTGFDTVNTAGPGEPVDALTGGVYNYCDLEYGYNDMFFAGDAEASMLTTMTDVGNISEDPLFQDTDEGDYSLTAESPCVDTGTEENAPLDDIDGWTRPVDGNGDGVWAWDMGAYEYYDEMARDSGTNRYMTSVKACQEHFEYAETVIVSTGEVFADGLSAAGLAGSYDAPLLLSPHAEMPAVVKTEIQRLGATHAIVVGQTRALSDKVAADLDDMGLDVDRIGGADRYETAALIAQEIIDREGDEFSGIGFIARGDTFPDALSASPIAYELHSPILLVQPDQMPRYTVDIVQSAAFDRFVVVGGPAAVGSTAVQDVSGLATRISGSDRYETSAELSEYAIDEGWSSMALTGIATGQDFPDALTGGAAIGSGGGVMLLTPYSSLAPSASALMQARVDEILRVEILGGRAAVSDNVWNQISNIVD